MKNLFTMFLALSIHFVYGQDYQMYEVHYLRPLPGNAPAVEALIASHNSTYHNDGPYQNAVFSVVNGPNTGDYFFAMGPCTFSDLDNRPSSAAHNNDWAGIMALCKRIENVAYATRDDGLSITLSGNDNSPRPIQRVRYFEVSDNALFRKVQGQIVNTIKSLGVSNPRVMYQREFLSHDNVHWATVSSYKNWAEFDADNGGNFRETFEKVNGAKSWNTFQSDFDKAIVSRRDELRILMPELSGGN